MLDIKKAQKWFMSDVGQKWLLDVPKSKEARHYVFDDGWFEKTFIPLILKKYPMCPGLNLDKKQENEDAMITTTSAGVSPGGSGEYAPKAWPMQSHNFDLGKDKFDGSFMKKMHEKLNSGKSY